jgi:hypothetical protein
MRAVVEPGRPVVLDLRVDPGFALSVDSRSAALRELAAAGGAR